MTEPEVTHFDFRSKRIDKRREKKYGLAVTFYLRVKGTLCHQSAVEVLRKKNYSSVSTYGDNGSDGVCGTVVKYVDKPSLIPDSAQVIGVLGGLEEIKKDFVEAARAGRADMDEISRCEKLAAEAQFVYGHYWSNFSHNARVEIDYKAREEKLRNDFRKACAEAAKRFFLEYPDSTGIKDGNDVEYTCEPEALALARKMILKHAGESLPDNFFERTGSDLIKPSDFLSTKTGDK